MGQDSKADLLPEVIEKSPEEIDKIIAAINGTDLSSGYKTFIISCIKLALWLPMALHEKAINLHKLKKLLFGKGSSYQKEADKAQNDQDVSSDHPEPDPPKREKPSIKPSSQEKSKQNKQRRQSSTKLSPDVEKAVSVAQLQSGSDCPDACGGKIYAVSPGVLVRIKGQKIANIERYHLEKLRCGLCGKLYTAEIPESAGDQKYDARFKSLLALMKYYVGIPFKRQESFQKMMGFPLADATQWDLVESLADCVYPAFYCLEKHAANGHVVHNDDSYVKIIELMQQNKAPNIGDKDNIRTGMFTSGILSYYGEQLIALFYNGRAHAGENLDRILAFRDKDKESLIQMCDALSRNIPRNNKTIVCNCLAHGFRLFDDLFPFYPDECYPVMKLISQVYEVDRQTRNMSALQRLYYHRRYSKPIMMQLKKYLLNKKTTIEPNSSLGKAMHYMIKHWEKLSRFLSVAGAPLDNNILERALKIPIRGRNNWQFYKTQHGANVGGMLTSLIYTCYLNDVNPLDYLTALQENKSAVFKDTENWLPWTYNSEEKQKVA